MMAEIDEYLFWIGLKLECLNLPQPADLYEVRKKTIARRLIRYKLLINFAPVTATMSKFVDVT